jgi:predicted RNA-binding Zn ribbon-like protein
MQREARRAMSDDSGYSKSEGGAGGGGFFFVGGNLALDLVNTEAAARGRPVELLPDPAALALWWQEARRHHPEAALPTLPSSEVDERLLAVVKQFRAALRRLFEAVAAGDTIDDADLGALNDALAAGREMVDVSPTGEPRLIVRNAGDMAAGALLPLARSATMLLTGTDRVRLHRCANRRCVLLFFDATKSGTRRWCSIGCMNRWRSSERYRKRKGVIAS